MRQDVDNSYVALRDDDVTWSPKARKVPAVSAWRTLQGPVVALVMYFVVGYMYYSFTEGWNLVDCIYFSVEIVTTVGYGDISPTGDKSMVFTSFYIVAALTIVAASLSKILSIIVIEKVSSAIESVEAEREASIMAMQGAQNQDSKQQEASKRHKRWRYFRAFGAYLFWIAFGTIYYGTQRDLTSQLEGDPIVHAFYFSVVTLCTVGLGDFVPKTDSEKLVDVFFMLVGIPTFANALNALSEMIWTSNDDVPKELAMMAGLDPTNLMSLFDFETQLAQTGCGSQDDDKIDRFEYLAFILVSNSVLRMEVLKEIMQSFDALDQDGNGYLEHSDLPTSFAPDSSKAISEVNVQGVVKNIELDLQQDLLEAIAVNEAQHAGLCIDRETTGSDFPSTSTVTKETHTINGISNTRIPKCTQDRTDALTIGDTNDTNENNLVQCHEPAFEGLVQRVPLSGVHMEMWTRLSQVSHLPCCKPSGGKTGKITCA